MRHGRILSLALLALCLEGPAAAAYIHTSDADFLTGSDDGGILSGAGDGEGSLRLEKLPGALGAWSMDNSFPVVLQNGAAWAYGNRFVMAGFYNASLGALSDTVQSSDISGGVMGAWTWRSRLPILMLPGGTARWADRIYFAGAIASSVEQPYVYSAQLDAQGLPISWNALTPLPLGDFNARLAAVHGWLYCISGNDGGYGSKGVFSAPIKPDGTIGAWTALGDRAMKRKVVGIAYPMGSLLVFGGEQGDWAGEALVERAVPGLSGGNGSWASQSALPAPRSYQGNLSHAIAGRLYQVGGKTYSGGNVAHAEVYSNPLAAGGTLGSWATESSFPLVTSNMGLLKAGGRLYAMSASDSKVYSAPLNQGSANAAGGVYQNRFDLGTDKALGQLVIGLLAGTPAGSVQVRWRSAPDGGSFGAWSGLGSAPATLAGSARYVEYELELSDPGSGTDVGVTSVELLLAGTPTATATPSATPTETPSVMPTATGTATPTETPTGTPVDTQTPSATSTATLTVTDVPTNTASPTRSRTVTPTPSYTETPVPPTAVPSAEPGGPKGNPFDGGPGVSTAFPNPAQGNQVNFGFTMDGPGSATLTIWTAAGVLAGSVNGSVNAGHAVFHLDIRDYAAGVYLQQLVIHYDDGRSVSGPVTRFAVLP